MSRLISTQYYWQGMSKDIKQKVKTCPTCQLTKRPVGPTYGELSQPLESKEPFDLLSLDTIAGFAKYGNTKIYLHVVVDHFSRYAWTFPSKSTSIITYQQVFKRVLQDGSPKRLLTDRAPAFTSPKFRSFLLNRNIHPLLTTSNNPQANGLCERLNATLTGKLRLLHLENPKVAWTKLVKKVTLIYNKTPHSTTGFPPIYLMFGILPPEISNHNTPYPDIDKARKIAHTRTQNKHLQDKNTYDQRHKQPHFEVGDLVLVKLYHHPNTGKLAPYFTGPHTILEIISPNVVRIDRPNQPLQRDTDTIHVNKLKLYTEKIHYISPPAVSTYHIKHNPNYTFPFKHLTPELFPTESLRFKPTRSEPFRHLDPAIFATRRFTSLFPDVKNCKPDNQLNHITPLPKDIKQENCESTNHSNSTINKANCAHDSDRSLSHITNHSTAHSVCNASFSVCAYHSTPFTAKWSVRKTSIASSTLDAEPQTSPPPMVRRMWTAEWNEIVFTDELRICLQHQDGQILVWRHCGQRMLDGCVMLRHTGPAPGIMVWGGIGYHPRTPPRIAGTLNSQRYISEVLEPVVHPYLQALPTAIFQQNNARPHVAHIFQRFFVNRQIDLLPWPARSPDLLPIENMWSTTIDPDNIPSCLTRSTLATCGSCSVCCTPRKHPKSF
ncbi:hypothetical protein LAZ67_15000423 [Cordylochernes scorpioides]|uniref:RNA-directed DNA polymerase n=1 Tax=Cordylochernes scorpioides TaxID=51811 RepID=A0ABY6LA22_9ARAC|nr:hypothetical protein LAZ67_15000423 [Cordylochernes scorpioides]